MSNENIAFDSVDGFDWISVDGWTYKQASTSVNRIKEKKESAAGSGEIKAPMPGQLLKIHVKVDMHVMQGDSLCVVEAMKMEHSLKAPFDGKVTQIHYKEGENLQPNAIILNVEKHKDN